MGRPTGRRLSPTAGVAVALVVALLLWAVIVWGVNELVGRVL